MESDKTEVDNTVEVATVDSHIVRAECRWTTYRHWTFTLWHSTVPTSAAQQHNIITSSTVIIACHHSQHLWQAEWDGCVLNKLHSVRPLLGYINLSSLSRQDAVVLRRLRIGHTRLTHSYLLNGQDHCSHCDCALTVAHVLLECNHYNVVRQEILQRFFSAWIVRHGQCPKYSCIY